jgi:hypothetical protein
MNKGFGALAVAFLVAVASPLAALATPVTYYFGAGAATVTLSAGATTIGAATLEMNGVYVTFDDELPSLVDFSFTTGASGTIVLSSPYGGYDEIEVLSSALSPGIGYTNLSASDLGGGSFFVAVSPVQSSGVFSASDSTGINPAIVAQAFNFTNSSPLVANLSIANGTLELTGITLAVLPPGIGDLEPLVISADVSWSSAQPIPEPSSIALALVGAAIVGFAVRRAR